MRMKIDTCITHVVFLLNLLRPPKSPRPYTLLPYTTLFRSRSPAALEKGPSRPEHDRRRKDELDPGRDRWRHDMMQGEEQMSAHLQEQHGQAEHQRDPEIGRAHV